jgi:glutamate synthase (NADPH) small chain
LNDIMSQNELRRLEDLCIQECAPWCTATCPVHVDVLAMCAAVSQGNFGTAAKVFLKSVPFPRIVCRICDHPCESVCKRREAGEAIAIRALEESIVIHAPSLAAARLRVQEKTPRVAVVGAGLSGLTAALELRKKGYPVVVFDSADRLGGTLWRWGEDRLPGEAVLEDLEVLKTWGIEFSLSTTIDREVLAPKLANDFQAVFIGTGAEAPCPFAVQLDGSSRVVVDPITFQTSTTGLFAGGSAIAGQETVSPIRSISQGKRAAISIDRFLQRVSLTASRDREGTYETRLFTSIEGAEPAPRVPTTARAPGYSPDEAQAEAARCFQCECMECVKICDFLAHYKGYPKKYIRQIYNNLSIVMGQRHGNQLINTCSLCGLCKEVCPESLHMGEVCKAARSIMVKQGRMPPSAHEFALQDMGFSNSDKAALARMQPDTATNAYVFFPGCQLTGSSPDLVMKTYQYLTDRLHEGVGIMLRCCGAPADWAGQEESFGQVLTEFREQWTAMGKPQVILACSSCLALFKAHLPDVPLVSLWEFMDQRGLPSGTIGGRGGTLAIHDPCTSRHEPTVQQSVRRIVLKLGYTTEELKFSGTSTECCGFGGLMYFANRAVAKKVIQRRIGETEQDLLAYCAVCRDFFVSQGKPTWHLLDLIFGDAAVGTSPPRPADFSQRRENRVRLKNRLLTELWSEKGVKPEGYQRIKLRIPEKVSELMNERLILVEDLQHVIHWAESNKRKLVHSVTGHSLAHYRPGAVTYWVEYSVDGDEYIVHNAYCHRMEVMEEANP